MANLRKDFEKFLKERLSLKGTVHSSAEQSLIKIFKYQDLNNNGLIELNEFIKATEKIGINHQTPAQLKELFIFYDQDSSGNLDYKEFSKLLFGTIKPKTHAHEDPRLAQILQHIITYLTKRGFRSIFQLTKLVTSLDPDRLGNFPARDLHKLANFLDLSEADTEQLELKFRSQSSFEYKEFLDNLILEPDGVRMTEIKQCFEILDQEQRGQVDLAQMKQQFNSRGNPAIASHALTEEQVLEEFIDCLDTFVAATRGVKATNLTRKDFQDFYSYLSTLVHDNAYYVHMVQSHFERPAVQEPTPLHQSMPEHESPSQRVYTKAQRKDQQESYNVLKQGQDDVATADSPSKLNPKESFDKLVAKLQKRGGRGMLSLAKSFKKADNQKNQRVDFDSYKEICAEQHLVGDEITSGDIINVFQAQDAKRSGSINYLELLNNLKGPFSNFRRGLLERAFESLDKEKLGRVQVEDLKLHQNSQNHPDVKLHKKTDEEVLEEFLETFELWKIYVAGKSKDTTIELNDFLDQQSQICFPIDHDTYFEKIIKSVYQLDEYADSNAHVNAGVTHNSLFNEQGYSSYIKDHHKSLLMGGVSASAPFGTYDNSSGSKDRGAIRQGSRVSPFGTDDNEYSKQKPMHDHRQNGKSLNEPCSRTLKSNTADIQKPSTNLIHTLREKLVKRGTRAWFNLFKNFKLQENNHETITTTDLALVLKNLRFDLDSESQSNLFKNYDKAHDNKVKFQTLILDLVLLSEKREQTVLKLWRQLSKHEKVDMTPELMKKKQEAELHPTIKNQTRNSFEVWGEFSDCLSTYCDALHEPKVLNFDQFRLFWLMYGSNQRDDMLFDLIIEKVYKLENEK